MSYWAGLAVLVVVAAIVLLIAVRCRAGEGAADAKGASTDALSAADGLELTTATSSRERALRTGLKLKGSEDASRLLSALAELDKPKAAPAERDQKPLDEVEWVVEVELEDGAALDAAAVEKAFDSSWRVDNGRASIYGQSSGTARWAPVPSKDSPGPFRKIALTWALHDNSAEDKEPATAARWQARRAAVEERAKRLGKARVKANRTCEEAEALARDIAAFVKATNYWVEVQLAAPDGSAYKGRDVWDVMMSLGLEWGDMDLFHRRDLSGVGEYHFSVYTSTPPGYFLPEEIADGNGDVKDLLFGFSAPRTREPEKVFDAMTAAMRYAQKRLGGQLHVPGGQPFDESAVRKIIKEVVRRMDGAELKPGDDAALTVF